MIIIKTQKCKEHNKLNDPEFELRPMHLSDLDQVYELEKRIFPSPWSKASFRAEINNANSSTWVVSLKEDVIAYSVAWQVHDELHIANIAVKAKFRKCGIASALLYHLLISGKKKGTIIAHLEVRESNKPAQSLYEKFGFQKIGCRKKYYQTEDAILMSLNLENSSIKTDISFHGVV